MGWLSELRRELKGQVDYQETRHLGRMRRDIPNPLGNHPEMEAEGDFRYKLTEGYEVEPDGEVVKSEGIIEALLKWF